MKKMVFVWPPAIAGLRRSLILVKFGPMGRPCWVSWRFSGAALQAIGAMRPWILILNSSWMVLYRGALAASQLGIAWDASFFRSRGKRGVCIVRFQMFFFGLFFLTIQRDQLAA